MSAYAGVDITEERELFRMALNNPVLMQEGVTYNANNGTYWVIADGSIQFNSKDGKKQLVYAPGTKQHDEVLKLFGASGVQTKSSQVGAQIGTAVGTFLQTIGVAPGTTPGIVPGSVPGSTGTTGTTGTQTSDDDQNQSEGWGGLEWTLAIVGGVSLVGGIGYLVYTLTKPKPVAAVANRKKSKKKGK